MNKPTMTVNDIMALGMTKATSYSVLRQAKHIMIQRGFDFYDNKRLGTVPTEVVGEIFRIELTAWRVNILVSQKTQRLALTPTTLKQELT